MDNYYELLGIDPSADEDKIREAIRTSRKRYRQVAGSPNKEQARNAEVMMDKLAAAESDLLDADKRKSYDARLISQPVPQAAAPAATSDWVETAKTYLANGSPRNAAQAAKQATVTQPESVEAWTVRAYAALELKDYSDADFAASEAQRREPGNAQISGLLGDVYDAEGDYRQAERAFARAAELESSNPYWHGRVAWAVSDQGRTKEALALANQITASFATSDYAKKVHAFMLLKDAESVLSRDSSGIYFTNKNQITYVEQRLAEVAAIGSAEPEIIEYYNETQGFVARAKVRRFTHISFRRIVLAVVLIIVMLVSFGSNNPGLGFFVLILAGLWIWWTIERCWPRQWKVNKKALGAAAKSGLQ